MSLGCGAHAGNITSDNITPLHLINIKRVARAKPRGGAVQPRVAPDHPVAQATPPAQHTPPLDFVCEDDVRRAVREGRTLRLSARAIVTPAARDAAAGHDIFVTEA
jgi:hypothetical protein